MLESLKIVRPLGQLSVTWLRCSQESYGNVASSSRAGLLVLPVHRRCSQTISFIKLVLFAGMIDFGHAGLNHVTFFFFCKAVKNVASA